MSASQSEVRWSPAIILLLLVGLVTVSGLWVVERAGDRSAGDSRSGSASAEVRIGSAGAPTQSFRWKMVTTWPKNFPGLGMGAENFARMVDEMSDGRLQIRVYGAGEVVPAFGVFDAVSQGVAEAGHGAAYYWTGKIPAAAYFTSIPFGFTAQSCMRPSTWCHSLQAIPVSRWAVGSTRRSTR